MALLKYLVLKTAFDTQQNAATVNGAAGRAVVGVGGKVGGVVIWVVINGMWASAELPGVTTMAAVVVSVGVVVVAGMRGLAMPARHSIAHLSAGMAIIVERQCGRHLT